MVKTTQLIFIFTLVFFCLPSYADSPYYILTFGEYGLAKTAGFNQIPRGGDQASSSYRRPNFNELNIGLETYHTFGAGVQYGTWQMVYSHSAIHLENSAMLNQALFSHGKSLPIDVPYHFNIELNKNKIQFKKQFSSLPQNNNFHFAIFSNIDWIGYHYHFYPLSEVFGVPAPSSDRDFINLSCSFGTEFQYRWHPYFSSALSLSASLPLFHLHISEARLVQRFHLFDTHLSKLTPYVGISYLKIDLQDGQGLANHLRFTAKPYFFIGAEFLLI